VTDVIRVLIVDDDVPTRVGVRTILMSEPDIEIVGEAATGEEAITLARTLAPDVALVDIRLPDIDGIAVTQRMLDGVPADGAAPLRVLVLTTFDHDQYAYRSLQAGASGFLLKRTRAEDLIDAVRTVATGNALPTSERTRALIAAYAGTPDGRDGVQVESLTPRESEVLTLVGRGLTNAEIAETLGLSIETVRTHVKRVYMKCGVRDRAQAVIVAYETGLIPLSS
jgi:DNA-binding NarL/FixJ family response regulator